MVFGPQQVVLVTSRAGVEQFGKKIVKDDIDSVYWHMPLSHEEKLYAISIPNSKYVLTLIEKSGIFCVNFIPGHLAKSAQQCSLIHGEHVNKFDQLGLDVTEANGMECLVLRDAMAYLECSLHSVQKFQDYSLIIAKIINSSVMYEGKRLFENGE